MLTYNILQMEEFRLIAPVVITIPTNGTHQRLFPVFILLTKNNF